MNNLKIPANATQIIERLEQAGFEAYVVGGCVRDSLLGKTPHDWDITTSALPEQVKSLFSHTVDTGLKHGTVTVLIEKEGFEVTTYRIDGEYDDGRHPNQVQFTLSLEEDLKRRDFTINAMAYNPLRGLVDLFGGINDLENKIVKCVGNPKERFSEDALRMMRAVRFAAQLDFEIDSNTKDAIKDLAPTLEVVSAERIREELCKLLVSGRPGDIVTLYELGLTKVFLPEFDVMMTCEQNTPHHMYTVGMHTVECLRLAPDDLVLRLVMLLHDVAKPEMKTTSEDGRDHFRNHPIVGAERAKEIMHRLRFDNETTRKVVRLVRYHDERPRLTKESVRKTIVKIGADAFPDFFVVQRADIGAQSLYEREQKEANINKFQQLYREIIEEHDCLSIKDMEINGRDLIDMGMKPGPEMGDVLDALFEEVVEDPKKNKRNYLFSRAKSIANLCVVIAVTLFLSVGCGQKQAGANFKKANMTNGGVQEQSEETEISDESLYVVKELDVVKQCLTVVSLQSGNTLRFDYKTGTEFFDEYGDYEVWSRFFPGTVVTLGEVKTDSTVSSVSIYPGSWRYDDITDYKIDIVNKFIDFAGEKYMLSNNAAIISKDDLFDIGQIKEGDKISIVGEGKEVYCIVVSESTGILKLTNTSKFDGSVLDIGGKVFAEVSRNAEIDVPEGTYTVTAANAGYGGECEITIVRGETTVIDMSQLEGEGPRMCQLHFNVGAENCKIYLDGELVENNSTKEVRYGTHTLAVSAPGYETWKKYLVVNSATADIDIGLDETDSATNQTQTVTDETLNKNATNGTITNGADSNHTNNQLAGALAGSLANSIINGTTNNTTTNSNTDLGSDLQYYSTLSNIITNLLE